MSNKFIFQKLTPKNDVDIDGYEQAIEHALKDNDIQNIAITGTFGAGKSSIIKTYAAKNNKKFMYISLASFCDDREQNNRRNVDRDCSRHDDYVKIYRYEIEEKIINSLVQQASPSEIPYSKFHIKNVSEQNIQDLSLSCIIITIFFILTYILRYRSDACLLYITLLIGIAVAIIIGILVYKSFVWIIKSASIKRISTKIADISVQDDNSSYFDRNLDEILYLITNIKCDGLVFEDIDRIQEERIYIFQELREICSLSNQRNVVLGKEKIVKFFYLVVDDVFEPANRVKFFDYIIPVVPYTDASNSYSILRDYIDNTCEDGEIDDMFVRRISLYVEDLRIINNIINEYQIYRSKLNNTQRDMTGLLAMIIYKNTHPHDFSKLQKDSGLVYNFFAHKKDIVDEKISAINDSRDVYNVNKYEYIIKSQKLHQLIEGDDNSDLFAEIDNNTKDADYNKLLIFLLKTGYVNEDNYRDNLSYFRPRGLSLRDKNFLIAIGESKMLEFEYKLDDPAVVCKYLDEGSFQHKSSCNFTLIDYIISKNMSSFIGSFISQLEEDQNIEFVYNYYISTDYKDKFVSKITEKWYGIIKLILSYECFLKDINTLQDFIVRSLIVCSNKEILISQNKDNCINEFLNEKSLYIDCKKSQLLNLMDGLKTINMKFNNLRNQINNDGLFDNLYDCNMYELNISNIKEILRVKYGLIDNSNHLLTNVYLNKDEKLYNYVIDNIDSVVEIVVDNYESIDDYEDTIVEVVDSLTVEQLRDKYISKLSTNILQIDKVDELYWACLLEYGKIIPSFSNILSYYNSHQYKGPLAEYINNHWNEIDFTNNNVENEDVLAFWNASSVNDDLCIEAYSQICKCIGMEIETLTCTGLSSEKIDVLISEGLLSMNINNLKIIRMNYKDKTCDYIVSDLDNYLNLINPADAIADEIKNVLNDLRIDKDVKIAIIDKYSKKISLKNVDFDDDITLYIIGNCYDKNDNEYLLTNYSSYTLRVQECIYSIAENNTSLVIDKAIVIDKKLMLKLFEGDILVFANKISILDKIINECDDEYIEALFITMGKKYASYLFSTQKHYTKKVEDTEENRKVLDLLEKKNRIKSYDIEEGGLRINKCD